MPYRPLGAREREASAASLGRRAIGERRGRGIEAQERLTRLQTDPIMDSY